RQPSAAPQFDGHRLHHPFLDAMPFLRVDAYEGRSKEQVKELLDGIHRAILSAFGVPLRDRYQVYQVHSQSNFIVQDTGLGIDRTKNVVFIGIASRQRTEQQKTTLYTKLVEELKVCGIEQNDIVVSIVTNSDADWSFGNGRAQFLTGEL
ncbi:MAG: hypothetical protein QOF70_4242, partial [Acetobacteraceae bacterium]|nr:hypothetical protein [Acetobacteraceae bacterium]